MDLTILKACVGVDCLNE